MGEEKACTVGKCTVKNGEAQDEKDRSDNKLQEVRCG